MWKRVGLVLVSCTAAFFVFGDSTSSLYRPQVALVSCMGPIVVFAGAVVVALDNAAAKQYKLFRWKQEAKTKSMLDDFATPATGVRVCQRCGSTSVIEGMCTVCDAEIGILEDEAEVGIL